ncbi:MAG: S26 family signal peptidase [Planctomycetota bacterium]
MSETPSQTQPASSASSSSTSPSGQPPRPRGLFAVKEAFTSIVIAFAMAFAFRGFVLEAFVIPTGSMAPTLLGQHHRLTGPQSGYSWTIGPWLGTGDAVVRDPMVGSAVSGGSARGPNATLPRRAGDRIFVLKYLPPIYSPKRWDVSVFKYPPQPQTNYIKRLIGLPGEQIALIDGDVFVRPAPGAEGSTDPKPPNTWNAEGWEIARKPERIQRAIWQDVYDSRFAPIAPVIDGRRWFRRPWLLTSVDATWSDVDDERVYQAEGAGRASMTWDTARPITDETSYNWTSGSYQANIYPVSDVATRADVEPNAAGVTIEIDLGARRHEFRALIADGRATLQMRDAGSAASQSPEPSAWTTLGEGAVPEGALAPGEITPIEFWHVDQELRLWVAGEPVVDATYDWTPVQRVRSSLGIDLTDPATLDAIEFREDPSLQRQPFADPRRYRPATLAWHFEGAGVTVHRSVVKRDQFYQPGLYSRDNDTQLNHSRRGQPSLGTHPGQTATLGADQFLLLGDNSAASADGRVWERPSPWVAEQVDDTIGVVHRDLLIGRAFIVYFPAPHPGAFVPIPDAGRVRWIW